jgi:uncharacterized membrane protein YebE (DUF533 family)
MDIEDLVGTMIRGSLGGRRKRHHGVGRFLAGGGNSFLTASTLLTVGGLVWGVIETMQQQSGQGTTAAPGVPAPPVPVGPGQVTGPGLSSPPPLPGSMAPPPLPAAAGAPDIPDGAVRLIRLMVSAARADGQASDVEKQAILAQARNVGADGLVEAEWNRPTPLSSIVAGLSDPQQRADVYVLAYSIVRADEGVSGAERIYLAQLASLLDLDPARTGSLERDADARIAAAVEHT